MKNLKLYRHLFLILTSIVLTILMSCASKPDEYLTNITQSKSNPLLKEFEYEQFSRLQLQAIRENALYSYLSYMGGFSDFNFQTLAILAVKSQQLDLLPKLIEHGINLNSQDDKGWTALMYAVLYPNSLEVMRILIKEGRADLNIQNNEGKTALMLALEYNASTANVKYLLENMADYSLEDSSGLSAWDYAQENPYVIYTNFSVNLVSSTKQQFFELLKVPGIKNVETLNYSDLGGETLYKNGETPLMWIAKYNTNPTEALKEFALYSDINAVDLFGNNVVHYAMQSRVSSKIKIAALRALKELDAPMQNENYYSETPFLTAIKYGADTSIVNVFSTETNLDENPNNTLRALFYACKFNTDISLHKMLIDIGFDTGNLDENDRNLVYYLAAGKNIDAANLYTLYKKLGVDFRQVDSNGNPALYYVVKRLSNSKILDIVLKGNEKFAEKSYLLQSNLDGMTLLHVSAKFNKNFEVAKYITDSSSSVIVRAKDAFDYTPLHYALMSNENEKIAKHIFDKTPELLRTHTMKNETLLMTAAKNPYTYKTLDLILIAIELNEWEEKEEIINSKDFLGNTALHYAMQYSSNSIAIDRLIKNGADINAKNNLGQTPLMFAAFNTKNPAAFRYLIAQPEIDMEATDNNNQTAFVYAAEYGRFAEYINLFYQYQANDKTQNIDGESIKYLMQKNMYLAPYVDLVE